MAKSKKDLRSQQLEWFREVVKKDSKFYLAYILAFGFFILKSEPCPTGFAGVDGTLVSSQTRVLLTALFAIIALYTLWVDIYHSTLPEPGDRKWKLLLHGSSGHFSYLTVNIITTWSIYWPLCALVEYLWRTSETELIRKAVTCCYSFAVFSSSLGTLLSLLFLQFNWFNESWRKETLELYESRGNKTFKIKILFTHLNQLPIAFFDIAVLKQNHHILENSTPRLQTLILVSFLYVLGYVSFTHFNFRVNGGVYPYSFMDATLSSWKSELIFIAFVSLFCFLVTAFYHFIAVESDFVECSKLIPKGFLK